MAWNKPTFTEAAPITLQQIDALSNGIDGLITGALPAAKAVTQTQADDSTNVATTSYVRQAIGDALNITEATIQTDLETTPPFGGISTSVKRQANFVIGHFNGISFAYIPNGAVVGVIPDGFRPTQQLTTFGIAAYLSNVRESFSFVIYPNGEIKQTGSGNIGAPLSLQIAIAYEVT